MKNRTEYDFSLIGINLRKRREELGYSVEDVRRYMMVGSPQAIYKWEKGRGLPQADSLLALLELYGIYDFRQLLEGEDEASPPFLFI